MTVRRKTGFYLERETGFTVRLIRRFPLSKPKPAFKGLYRFPSRCLLPAFIATDLHGQSRTILYSIYRAEDTFSRAEDTFSAAEDTFNRAEDVFNRAEDGLVAAEDTFNRAEEVFSAAEDTFNRAEDVFSAAEISLAGQGMFLAGRRIPLTSQRMSLMRRRIPLTGQGMFLARRRIPLNILPRERKKKAMSKLKEILNKRIKNRRKTCRFQKKRL